MDTDRHEPYLSLLPIGDRLAPGPFVATDLFPYEGDVTVKALEAPVLPEPARGGTEGDCGACANPDGGAIWRGDGWRVTRAGREPSGLPMVVMLLSDDHHDLEDLPPDLVATLGMMIQRICRAVSAVPGVGRVHVYRWGDGGEHFHMWFMARPAGMMQMRGMVLPLWYYILPPVPEQTWDAWLSIVAAELARDGGTAIV
jgi:diadenosine tetraphosphate (Ap4A) HIT family hydrolase